MSHSSHVQGAARSQSHLSVTMLSDAKDSHPLICRTPICTREGKCFWCVRVGEGGGRGGAGAEVDRARVSMAALI